MKKIPLFIFTLLMLGVKAQLITTIAGNGSPGTSGNGGPATAAEFEFPFGIAVDLSDNFYVLDYDASTVRMVNTSGIISAYAGNGVTGYSGDGGPATAAEIAINPWSITSHGNLYICDGQNSRVRYVNNAGYIYTIAGSGSPGFSGDGGQATAAELNNPTCVAFDNSGNMYVADCFNERIRMVNPSGIISTIAGTGNATYGGDGGPATAASFYNPEFVEVDNSGNVYVADCTNDRVRKINTSGIITTCAGNGVTGYYGDGGPATAAELNTLRGITLDNSGNLCLTDCNNHRIREVNSSGIISTIAGDGSSGFTGDGGPATNAEISPLNITFDYSGNLYIADQGNFRIRKVTGFTGETATLASQTNVKCHGESNGSAGVSVTGGQTPYTYSWSPSGGTNYSATGLSAGSYTVTVIDNNGHYSYITVTITQPLQIRDSMTAMTGPNCHGGSNGTASVGVKYGTSPYTYLWNPSGQTTASASGLSVGTYTVSITDKNGCTGSGTVIVTQPPQIRDSIIKTSVTNIKCYGVNDGQATVGTKYGTPPYTYLWSPIGKTTAAIIGLSAGIYSVTVTDKNGCTGTTATVTITQPTALRDSISSYSCVSHKTTATVGVKGGTTPYTYDWLPGSYRTATVTGLANGSYTVTIADKNGCTANISATFSCAIAPPPDYDESEKTDCCPEHGGVTVYPNPNKGVFTIQSSAVSNQLSVEVYNMLGQKVTFETLKQVQGDNLDISSQPSGIYLYRVITPDGALIGEGKIIVEK